MAEMRELTGLWLNDRPGGKKYMSGTASIEALRGLLVETGDDSRVRFLVFKNENRRSDRDPEYRLKYVILDDDGPRQADRSGSGGQTTGDRTGNAAKPGSAESDLSF